MTILKQWLPDILKDPPKVDPNDIETETRHNTWGFSLDSSHASVLKISDFIEFIHIIKNHRKIQISTPMTFYCWFDEQACQLRIGLVSVDKNNLPFGCKVEHEQDLSKIIESFKYSKYHNGIPSEELEKVDFDAVTEEENNFIKNYVLKVWSEELKPE